MTLLFSVPIPASFLRLGFLGSILALFFFITTVASCCFPHIPPGVVLVTIYFLVGLCALLGYVLVPFSSHMFHIAWVEASFEVLSVYSIEEHAIGEPAALASVPTTPTTASYSTAAASSAPINC